MSSEKEDSYGRFDEVSESDESDGRSDIIMDDEDDISYESFCKLQVFRNDVEKLFGEAHFRSAIVNSYVKLSLGENSYNYCKVSELKPVEQTYKVGKTDVNMKVRLSFGKNLKSFGLHVISN